MRIENYSILLLFVLSFLAFSCYAKRPCSIKQSNCKKNCPCSDNQLKDSSINLFLTSILEKFTPCQCADDCESYLQKDCYHGICDEVNHRCVCKECWSGDTCEVFENKHEPTFIDPYTNVKLDRSIPVGTVITQVNAKDEDICNEPKGCDCSKIKYQIIETTEKRTPFSIDEYSGEIKVSQLLTKDKYSFDVVAKNLHESDSITELYHDESIVKVVVSVADDKNENQRKHHVERRGYDYPRCISYLASATPDVSEKYYFDRGEMVKFKIVGYHNASAVGTSIIESLIYLKSDRLMFNTSLLLSQEETSGSTLDPHLFSSGTLALKFDSLQSSHKYTAYVNATVKHDANALDPIFIDIYSTPKEQATDARCEIKSISDPILYVAHPTLQLTQTVDKDLTVNGEPIDYDLALTMPKFSMNTSVRITSASGDFVFMTLSDATVVTPIGADLSTTATPQPVYSSADATLGSTTAKFDFKMITVNSPFNNLQIQMKFKVTVHDHELLYNGTVHYISAAIEDNNRMIEAVLLPGTVIKIEPTLNFDVTTNGFAILPALFIGDSVNFDVVITHANSSNDNADDVTIYITSEYIVDDNSPANLIEYNATTLRYFHGTLNLGSSHTAQFVLKVVEEVSPLATVPFNVELTYKNSQSMLKKPQFFTTQNKIGTSSLAMTPAVSLVDIRPGDKVCFAVSALFDKIKSGAKFVLTVESLDGRPLFAIESAKPASGSPGVNIVGLATPTVTMKSTDSVNSEIKNSVTIDFGSGTNTNTGDTDDNKIKLDYCVVLSEHTNITNGSHYWIAVGMHDPNMLLVVKQLLTTFIPTVSRPYLELAIIANEASLMKGQDFMYNITVSHLAESCMFAHSLVFTLLFPMYITFNGVATDFPPNATHQYKSHFLTIKYISELAFTQTLNFGLNMHVEDNVPSSTGRSINAAGVVHLNYKSSDNQKFHAHSSAKVPIDPLPSRSEGETIPSGCKPEYYEFGAAVVSDATPNAVYVCFGQKKKLSDTDKGCFVTTNDGSHWEKISSKVGSVVGTDSNGNVYGVSEDCKSYIMHGNDNKWVVLPDQQLPSGVVKTYQELTASSVGGPPLHDSTSVIRTDTHDVGVTGDGVYFTPTSTSNWQQKLTHPCLNCV